MVKIKWMLFLCLALPEVLAEDTVALVPRMLYPGENLTVRTWLFAPRIAAVQIVNVELRGPEVEAVPPRAVTLRLAKVVAKVEDVISGKPLPGTIEFYCFTNLTGVGNAPHRYIHSLAPGSRHIVFLREEAGLLRTMVDVNEPILEYYTGRHSQADLPQHPPSPKADGEWTDHPVADAFAYILLTPAEGSDSAVFSKTLPLSVSELFHFARTGYVVELLRRLQHSPDAGIQRAACDELVSQYRVYDACIEQLERSSDVSSQVVGAALARHAKADEPSLLEKLEAHPLEFADEDSDFGDFRGALRRFTTDRRSKVRERACEVLRFVYRTDEFPECLSSKP